MIKSKVFLISKENNAFLEFARSEPGIEHEEDGLILEKYMNHWFREHKEIEIVKISSPKWIENHLMVIVWYKV